MASAANSRAGFTLVETLAALAITSVIILSTGALLHQSVFFFDHGSRTVERTEQLAQMIDSLMRDFSAARFVTEKNPTGSKADFIGRPANEDGAAKILFVTTGGKAAGPQGEEVVSLTVEESGESTQLVRRRVAWRGPRMHLEDARPSDAVVLLKGTLKISFAFSELTQDGQLLWHDDWSGANGLPHSVRFDLRDNMTGADLLVGAIFPVHADAPAGCAGAKRIACLLPRKPTRLQTRNPQTRKRITRGENLNRPDPRRGVVLVTVLWTIALLSALAMAASTTFRGFAGIVSIDRDRVRADALLAAGLELSANVVAKFDDQPLTERQTSFSLATGTVRLRLSDEGGRINVNKAPVKVLAALLRSVGAADDADAIAKSIDVWRARDKADQPAAPQPQIAAAPVLPPTPAPTPAAIPGAGVPQSGPGDKADDGVQSFTDIRQLAQIPGMEPAYLAALVPLTTVFGDEKVNALSASRDVLAVLPGANAGRLNTFLEARLQQPIVEGRLQQLLGPMNEYVKLSASPVALIELTAELLDGYRATAKAVIVVLPNDTQPYRVLAWTPAQLATRHGDVAANQF